LPIDIPNENTAQIWRLSPKGPTRHTLTEQSERHPWGTPVVEQVCCWWVLFASLPENSTRRCLRTYLKIADCCRSDINVE
jgi:hypothetical protein